jgi:hypothetical protein
MKFDSADIGSRKAFNIMLSQRRRISISALSAERFV